MALYVITRKRTWGELRCFWSRELKPTWQESEAARFLSYASALRHASQFPELQDFAVVEWWLGKYESEVRR